MRNLKNYVNRIISDSPITKLNKGKTIDITFDGGSTFSKAVVLDVTAEDYPTMPGTEKITYIMYVDNCIIKTVQFIWHMPASSNMRDSTSFLMFDSLITAEIKLDYIDKTVKLQKSQSEQYN